MSKVVVGVFHDRGQAESALEDLKSEGLEKDVSLVARDEEGSGTGMDDQDLTEGAFTGGALGGIAGLLAGAGALLIPGVGPIIVAGLIAATLTGVVTGGIAGSLADHGGCRADRPEKVVGFSVNCTLYRQYHGENS